MGQPLIIRFKPSQRPAYRRDGHALAYVAIDFCEDKVLVGLDCFEDSPQGRFYQFGTRELCNEPGGPSPVLEWTSSPGEDYFTFLAGVVRRARQASIPYLEVPPLRIVRGNRPPRAQRKRHHLCMPQSRENFERTGGTQWPAIEIPPTPGQPTDLYLDGFVIQQVLIDFRDATLGVRWHKLVPGTWGDDDKSLVYAAENEKFDKEVLWEFLHAVCSGRTLRTETEAATMAAISAEFDGRTIERGWPVNRSLCHCEHLPGGIVDPPPSQDHRVRYEAGIPVRLAGDGRPWHLAIRNERE